MSGGDDGSESEGFLQRWSRRKQEARVEPVAELEPAPPPAQAEEPFDPLQLPPVESLTAESDFTQFFKAGVPEEVHKAALRKLWLTEPSVVNYVPLVENGWDFNSPEFSQPLAPDEVARLMQQFLDGFTLPEPKPLPAPESPADDAAVALQAPTPAPEIETASTAGAADTPPAAIPMATRRHGGALPS